MNAPKRIRIWTILYSILGLLICGVATQWFTKSPLPVDKAKTEFVPPFTFDSLAKNEVISLTIEYAGCRMGTKWYLFVENVDGPAIHVSYDRGYFESSGYQEQEPPTGSFNASSQKIAGLKMFIGKLRQGEFEGESTTQGIIRISYLRDNIEIAREELVDRAGASYSFWYDDKYRLAFKNDWYRTTAYVDKYAIVTPTMIQYELEKAQSSEPLSSAR